MTDHAAETPALSSEAKGAELESVMSEREQIVAWLRGEAQAAGEAALNKTMSVNVWWALDFAANAIARGDHLSTTEQEFGLNSRELQGEPALPTTIVPEAAIAFLDESARYFEKRPTNGEDAAHWAKVTNAKNCRSISALIAQSTRDAKRWRQIADGGEAVVEKVARDMLSLVFLLAQPDRGDVFSWLDDHSTEIARAVLAALKGDPDEQG